MNLKRFSISAALCLILGFAGWALSNEYYTHGSFPTTGSAATSAGMRAEFDSVTTGFNKLPPMAAFPGTAVIVNGSGTALSNTVGQLLLGGNLTLVGSSSFTINTTGNTSLTFPTTGTLATLTGAETFTGHIWSGGTFTGSITNSGTITGGTYSGGTLSGTTTNSGTISGGTISGASLTGGSYNGGTLSGTTTNSGTINGGNITGATISGSTISGSITTLGPTMNTARLLGRTTASSGAIEELTVGSSLTLSAGSLSGTQATTGQAGVNTIAAQSDVNAMTDTTKSLTSNHNKLVLGTPITPSGTAANFTGIPSGVRRVIITLSSVGMDNSGNILIQIGGSGGIETTTYASAAGDYVPTANHATSTAGCITSGGLSIMSNSSAVVSGQVILTLVDSGANRWNCSSFLARTDSANTAMGNGTKAIASVLDRVRITTVAGTSNWNAGTMNIMYER